MVSVPDGGRVTVEAPVAVPGLTPVIVVNGPVNVDAGADVEGSNTMTVPMVSVPDGGSVMVEAPVAVPVLTPVMVV
jgi:hypothetical protein